MTLIKIKPRGSEVIGRRNLVINGAMQVAQRGTSATSITAPNYYTVDRMQTEIQSAGTWTMTQSDDVPTGEGFSKSFKYDCTTADASLGTTDYFIQRHSFEGQDLQRLMYGTSDAKPVTISFYVKSNKTGTYVCELQQLPGDGTYPRSGKSFTINSANTWERKVITINGNTAKTLPDSNARGLDIMIWMAAGTAYTSGTFNAGNSWTTVDSERAGALNVNIADNTANEILFTGLQMEIGTSASDFEHRSFGEELALCQRYFQNAASGVNAYEPISDSHGHAENTTRVDFMISLHPNMRATPTATKTDNFLFRENGQNRTVSSINLNGASMNKRAWIEGTTSGHTDEASGRIYTNGANVGITLDAEL